MSGWGLRPQGLHRRALHQIHPAKSEGHRRHHLLSHRSNAADALRRAAHTLRRKVMQLASKLISSKRGAVVVAATAALLAGILILLYLNSYRSGIKAEGAPVTVIIA